MIQSLDLVTWVLIISAGPLASLCYIILQMLIYRREEEKLQLLRYLVSFDPEVGMYVYRENIFLTLIGGVFGLLLGRLLHIHNAYCRDGCNNV